MIKIGRPIHLVLFTLITLTGFSCSEKKQSLLQADINELNLKRGALISCGPKDKQFGTVQFDISCSRKVKDEFNLALSLLHSFEYDEAEKAFTKIVDLQPECAMSYWGIAMSNFHPLWTPPSAAELKKGAKAIDIAQALTEKTERETDYINAIASFYDHWENIDHRTRCQSFERAMEKLQAKYPNDKEASIFYALALDAAADPADKTYKKQKKAGSILSSIYPNEPNHPGIIHYLIHTYDYPELAYLALPAARKYASVAPSSAHALHMPSHIFTRLGLWDECIASNQASIAAAQCYAKSAGMNGHWDEELHGLDYLEYAYLQKKENDLAKRQWDYLNTITKVFPDNFKVAYAFAAVPSRYVLENKLWIEAATLKIHPVDFPWQDYPWQKAILHFTRLLGNVHLGKLDSANTELKSLYQLHSDLLAQKDAYKANQVQIQITIAEAWIKLQEANIKEAIRLMSLAANMEDSTEKHPVTPGEVLPARELLGDMWLQLNKPQKALEAYEADLQKHPNRYNGLYGAYLSATKTGDQQKANYYYQQLAQVADLTKPVRLEQTTMRY